MQDNTGFMWFGTKDGLNRYDGNSIKIFKHEDNNSFSLGNNTVWSLLEVSDGKIWVGTDRGIYVYNPTNNSFTKFNKKTKSNIEINGEVLDMKMDKSGCIWITSSNLFKYTISTGVLEAIFNNNVDNDPKTQPLSRAWSLNVDNDNQVWISFHYGGIRKYNPSVKQIKMYQQDAMGKDLTSLLISKTINIDNDYLLIASFNDGLRIMDKKTGDISTFPLGRNISQNLFVRDLGYFSDGNYWIGTESGLYIYNPASRETTHLYHDVNDRFSLSDNAIYSMYEDKEGGIWIGTYFGGINYFPLPYNHFEKHYPITNKNSLSGERVSGICEDVSGNIWIGTEDAGLNMFDIKTKQFRHYSPSASGLNYHNIHDIVTDGNSLWIATFSRGINVLNLKTNTWKHYVKGPQPGMLDNNDIFSLYKDKSNNIWVGTSTGAFLFDRKSEQFIKQDYMQQHYVSDITEDELGQIWFATYINGVYCFNPRTKELKNYNYNPDDPTSICHYKITSIFLDSKNRLWFASESKGICMFDKATEKFIRYSMKDGFSNNVIYKILEDNEMNLWLSSNLGLMRFNPETKQVRIFTKNNGLPGNQFNYKSGYKDKSGKMYFGSLNGLISFQPKQFIFNTHIPPVVITDFHLLNDNNSQSDNDPNTKFKKLKHTQSSFSISFSSLSYVAPEMNKYAYMMEGLDSDWNYLSSPQQITYSNLKHGKYIFRVKASNNDGLWNEHGDKLEIIISPPFWQTVWAYILYFIIVVAILFYIINYNKKK
jgi:ligand-binding sensor domain-containing protein